MIHPTAIVHPKAVLDPDVDVGPYAVIDAGVVMGGGCRVGPHAHITGNTRIGSGNVFHAGCVIGDAPQDLKYRDEPTSLEIGDGNVFREHATVHRSNKGTEATRIGSHNYLMANSHVGHNVQIGDRVIVANGVLLAGHAMVEDRAFISGNSLVHQFVRVGSLALMQGGSAISKDLPPFTIATGRNTLCGLNIIGLRRAGISPDDRMELKRLYRHLFRSGRSVGQALASAGLEFSRPPSRAFLAFVAQSKRGICADSSALRDRGRQDLDEDPDGQAD